MHRPRHLAWCTCPGWLHQFMVGAMGMSAVGVMTAEMNDEANTGTTAAVMTTGAINHIGLDSLQLTSVKSSAAQQR